jgi:hypothetical protein
MSREESEDPGTGEAANMTPPTTGSAEDAGEVETPELALFSLGGSTTVFFRRTEVCCSSRLGVERRGGGEGRKGEERRGEEGR